MVDLVGVSYADKSNPGLRFTSLKPQRIVDSRLSQGAKQTQELTAPSSVAALQTYALVTNTTAVRPTASTYLTLWCPAADLVSAT